jgi:hypothetical protein
MTISKDLFLSILSMDAYNRGYNPGMAGLSQSGQIGNATIGLNSAVLLDANGNRLDQPASFYGLAYNLTKSVGTPGNQIASGTTIISYRGTDDLGKELFPLDLPMSFMGASGHSATNTFEARLSHAL